MEGTLYEGGGAMRIGLIGDTYGFVPALEAAVAGCRAAACDRTLSTTAHPILTDRSSNALALTHVCAYARGTPPWYPCQFVIWSVMLWPPFETLVSCSRTSSAGQPSFCRCQHSE